MILTVFEVRNGLEGQTVGVQRPWSTDFPGRVPTGKQVELRVNEDPRGHRIGQSATKSVWREHRKEKDVSKRWCPVIERSSSQGFTERDFRRATNRYCPSFHRVEASSNI